MMDDTSAAQQVRAAILATLEREGAGAGVLLQSNGGNAKPSRYNIVMPLTGGRSLAYNTVSGAFAVWEPDDVALYERLQQEPMPVRSRELKDFVFAGYVVPEDMDEVAEQETRYRGARFDPSKLTLTVAPTMACNFGCDYCFQGANKPTMQMRQDVQDAFIAYLEKTLDGLRSLHIAWYGGEPLLGIKIIERLSLRILALCRQKRVSYSGFIVTNGYALNKPTAQLLHSLGIGSCQITLDGPAEHHDQRRALLSGRGTYDKILENLQEWINEVPIVVMTRVNIDERNYESIRGLLHDLAARGFGRRRNFTVYFAPVEAITDVCHGCSHVAMTKRGYAKHEAELYRLAFELGLSPLPRPPQHLGNCQAIRPGGLLLLPTGELHKCWDTVHDTKQRVGSIFEVDRVSEHPKYKAWIEWSPFNNSTCRSCRILPNCAGACAHKFVNRDKTLGEAGALPCPSWKFNIVERLLLRAEKMGVITPADIPEGLETSPEIVGNNHTFQSVESAAVAIGA